MAAKTEGPLGKLQSFVRRITDVDYFLGDNNGLANPDMRRWLGSLLANAFGAGASQGQVRWRIKEGQKEGIRDAMRQAMPEVFK